MLVRKYVFNYRIEELFWRPSQPMLAQKHVFNRERIPSGLITCQGLEIKVKDHHGVDSGKTQG